MDIAISSCEQGTFQGSRADFGYLRLYANGNWVDSDGFQHIGGAVDSSQYFDSFDCTIDSDGIIHIPSINIQTTTDAMENPNVRITAAVYVGNNKTHSNILTQNVFIPVDLAPSTTWENIREANLATQAEIGLPPLWWTLVQGLFSTLTDAAQKASRVIFGVLKTSVDPADAANPIAVGNNDPRVNVLNADLYDSYSDAVDAAEAAGILAGKPAVLSITTAITVNGSKTAPNDVIHDFSNGGKLVITSGTVTIQGEIRAPAQQIFELSGGTVNISAAKFTTAYFEWYGITSGGDNTTAIQRLITARAGTYFNAATVITLLPNTVYSFASPISFNNTYGISIIGGGGWPGNLTSELRYTGSGSTTAVTMKTAIGMAWTNVKLCYTSASFTGILLESGHAPSVDTNRCTFIGCSFTGAENSGGVPTAYTAAALVSVELGIMWAFRDCNFAHGLVGVSGGSVPNYAYVVEFDNCQWYNCGTCIYNTDQCWSFTNCTFEPTRIAMAGGILADELRIIDGDGSRAAYNLTFQNNWIGDQHATASTYSVIRLTGGLGVSIAGNFFGLVPAAGSGGSVTCIEMDSVEGCDISANYLAGDVAFSYTGDFSNGVSYSANKVETTTKEPVEVGGKYALSEVRWANKNVPNYVRTATTFLGGPATDEVSTVNRALTIGNVVTDPPDTGTGAAIRTTFSVAGIPENSVIIQPRTDQDAWVLFWMFGDFYAQIIKSTSIDNYVPTIFHSTTYSAVANSPSQITSNQNNYTAGADRSYFQRWSTDASRNITGLSLSQIDGQAHRIVNVGSTNIVLVHQSGSSTAGNRFLCTTGADITLSANQEADLIYDATTARWRVSNAVGDNDPRARYDQTTISIAGSGTTSPTADAIDYPIVELTGALTGDRIINWPVTGTRDTIVFWNNTTGIYNVYVKAATETEAFVIVPQGTQSSLLNDGTTVIDYSPVAYRPVSMAAFGDSITAGYGVVAGGDWPTLLSNSICSTVANRAVNGSNAADAATRLDNETMFQDQFVIIWVGHNDIAGGTVSSVLASIASMVADIDSENFLILGTLNQRSMVKFSPGWDFITELNDACAVLYPNNFFNMQEYLVSLGSGVDVTLDIIPAIYMQADGQHPNELGMETIAARLVIYFNKRVQEQRTLNIGAEDFIYTGNRPFLGAPNINDNFTVYLGNYPTDPTVIPTRSVVIAPHFEPSGAAQADFSVVVGSGAGVGLTDANSVYIGAFAGGSATNGGNSSTCVGYFSGNANGGFQNAFFGSQSGLSNTTGSYNTFIGRQAGASNLTGSQGVFIGTDAGNLHTAGNNVILIGYNVQASTTTVANELNIGNVIGGNLDTSVKKFGYAPGTGGAVTQGTSRTTTVVINKSNGEITLFSAAGSATATSFTVSNSTVVATDRIILNQKSGTNKYLAFVTAVGTGSFEITFFTTGGTAVDAPVIGFTVLSGVNA